MGPEDASGPLTSSDSCFLNLHVNPGVHITSNPKGWCSLRNASSRVATSGSWHFMQEVSEMLVLSRVEGGGGRKRGGALREPCRNIAYAFLTFLKRIQDDSAPRQHSDIRGCSVLPQLGICAGSNLF